MEQEAVPTILVVDDTADNLMLINAILKELYKTRLANGGARGLAMALVQPKPALILLDVIMPDVDGFEVCRRLKSNSQTSDIPVIFLTGYEGALDNLSGTGAIGVVSKPVDARILLKMIQEALT